MSVTEYANGIRFRLGPDSGQFPWKQLFAVASPRIAPRIRFWLETLTVSLPEDERFSRRRLLNLAGIPRMSTYVIASIINRLVHQMDPSHAYLNVGVWNGFSFIAGLLGNPNRTCIGVDNFSMFGGPRAQFLQRFQRFASPQHRFYDCDFREYFRRFPPPSIGVYYYDGPHDYSSQLAAMELAEPYLAEGSWTLVDDTNRPDPHQATLDFVARRPNQYRVVFDRTTSSSKDPLWWDGLMIVQKIGRS